MRAAGEWKLEASELREQPAAVGASAELAEIDPTAIAARSPWELFSRRFREDRLAMAALIFLVVLILVAVLAPLVVKLFGAPGPDERDTGALDPLFATPTGPSSRRTSSASTRSGATSSAARSTGRASP